MSNSSNLMKNRPNHGTWNYRVVSQFVNPATEVPITRLNILLEADSPDDLLEWEILLDKRGLDYCIVYSEETQRADSYYALITDMEKFSMAEAKPRLGLVGDEYE